MIRSTLNFASAYLVLIVAAPLASANDLVSRMDNADCVSNLETAALPKAPLDLSDPRRRSEYIRDVQATLSHNSRSIGESLEKVAGRAPSFDYVRRSLGDGKPDPERRTILSVNDELMEMTARLKMSDGFSAKEMVGHTGGALRKSARLLMKTPGVKHIIPTSLETRLNVFGYKKVDYEEVVGVIQAMINDVNERMHGAWDEIMALQTIVGEAEAKAKDYDDQLTQVLERIRTDSNLTDRDRELLENGVAQPLANAQKMLLEQIGIYRLQIEQRENLLQSGQPVIEATASTASIVIPALKIATAMYEDAAAVQALARVKPKLEGLLRQTFDSTARTLERTAEEHRKAQGSSVVTPEYLRQNSARMERVTQIQNDLEKNRLPALMAHIKQFREYNATQAARAELLSGKAATLLAPKE